jgi:uncharacterized phiE125 gp8 family phage protein
MSDDFSSALRLITPVATEPLTLAQAKLFLRIEHTGDDATIASAINSARQFAEYYLRTMLLPQTWEYTVANPCNARMKIPAGPIASITSITLTNEAGTSSAMSAGNYRLSADGFSILFVNPPQIEKLIIRFVAGAFTTPSDIPAPIIQGMLHHIAAMMEQRDGVVGLPMQAVNCYAAFRRVTL